MKKTEILDLMSRKLAPFMFLFGLYLLSYGHLSPGGGFQGGVVISSGVILLVIRKGPGSAATLFPVRALSIVETVTFLLLLSAGIFGMVVGVGFLGNPYVVTDAIAVPRVGFILLLNVLIGLKVGAGVSLICIHLFKEM